MKKSDHYYFTDSIFQLELNLHNIRRELILLIDEFERQDCSVCSQLKCRCRVTSPKQRDNGEVNVTGSIEDTRNKDGSPNEQSPSAKLLPKPKFGKEDSPETTREKEASTDIEAWIESSKLAQNAIKTKNDRRADLFLASLKNSWHDYQIKDYAKEKMVIDYKKEKTVFDDFKKERLILEPRFAAANAVDMFFNNFKARPASMTPASIAYITNKVAAVYAKQRKAEYSYF